jgi:hypothetical protein
MTTARHRLKIHQRARRAYWYDLYIPIDARIFATALPVLRHRPRGSMVVPPAQNDN